MSLVKRGKVWHYAFSIKGRRFRGSTHTTDKAVAARIVAKLRLEAVESVHFKKLSEITLAEAFLRYRDHSDLLPSAHTIAGQLEKLRALGDELNLSEITDAKLSLYLSARRGQKARGHERLISNSTINNELTMLRAVLNRASGWGVAVPSLNWKRHRLPEAAPRRRYLSVEEQSRLLVALRPDFRPLVQFCLLTGARLGSAVALTWDAVDYDAGAVTFRRMKGGGTHTIPLTATLRTLLANERGKHPIFVFTYQCAEDRHEGVKGVKRQKDAFYPYSRDGWRRPWARALETAGITGFRFHDLRHTAGSRVTRVAGIAVARGLLGHADITTTDRYSHVLMEDVAKGMIEAEGHTVDTALEGNSEKLKEDKV
jgi:integrase